MRTDSPLFWDRKIEDRIEQLRLALESAKSKAKRERVLRELEELRRLRRLRMEADDA